MLLMLGELMARYLIAWPLCVLKYGHLECPCAKVFGTEPHCIDCNVSLKRKGR